MPLSRLVGVFEPHDLAILQHLFEQVCTERSIDPAEDKGHAEHLVALLVGLSTNGISDEAGLLRAMNERKTHGRDK